MISAAGESTSVIEHLEETRVKFSLLLKILVGVFFLNMLKQSGVHQFSKNLPHWFIFRMSKRVLRFNHWSFPCAHISTHIPPLLLAEYKNVAPLIYTKWVGNATKLVPIWKHFIHINCSLALILILVQTKLRHLPLHNCVSSGAAASADSPWNWSKHQWWKCWTLCLMMTTSTWPGLVSTIVYATDPPSFHISLSWLCCSWFSVILSLMLFFSLMRRPRLWFPASNISSKLTCATKRSSRMQCSRCRLKAPQTTSLDFILLSTSC